MKKCVNAILSLIIVSLYFQLQLTAQVPEKMSYQAVIRDIENKLVVNTTVGIQVTILQDSVFGDALYIEYHRATTNKNGLVTFEIGGGEVIWGEIDTISWAEGPFFLKTETDPGGEKNYTICGTSQLLSVPFAFHANTAERISGTIIETDPVFNNSAAAIITEEDIAYWNIKPDSLTGDEAGFQDWDKNASDDFSGDYNDLSGRPTLVSQFANDAGYLQAETDPEFNSSAASGITEYDIEKWNNPHITYTETDPEFMSWDKSSGILINQSQITDLSFDVFEKELSEAENDINVGFVLLSTSTIYINGATLSSTEWSGVGSQILKLKIPIKLFDKLKVKK